MPATPDYPAGGIVMRAAPALALGVSLLLGLLFLFVPPSAAAQPQAGNAYAGSDLCLTCHEPLKEAFAQTRHAKVFTEQNARTPLVLRGREACHGQGEGDRGG